MSKFFNELKRRNVIKSTIAYLVVAWVLLQVFTLLLPIVSAPEWIIKAITLILAIGLPIWMIVSWIYDITPQGIIKTPEESEKYIYKELINKRTNAFIIISLSIAVIVMGLKISGVFNSNTEGEYAIAVLPFVNMSDDVDQEYFSDGISEEIINMLAQVPGLKVIARTSSFSFKGKNQDIKLIGEKLNVTHILEGSVRKSGNTLRITAQLINTSDGSHLYSDTFDRELEDIFNIQDEISQHILEAVKIELYGSNKEAVFKKYTDNVEAYELYLKGKFYYNKYTKESFLKAIDYFNQAIAIDPNYAIAHAGISWCYLNLAYWLWLPTDQSLPLAYKAAQKAIKLDGQIAESHLAIGRLKMHFEWNLKDAMIHYKKAMAINPNNPEVYQQLSMVSLLNGNVEEAIENSNKAISLDPFSAMNLWISAVAIMSSGDSEKIIEYCKQIIDLDPNFYGGYLWLGEYYLFYLDQYENALIQFKLAASLDTGPHSLSSLGGCYAYNGDHDKAREILEELKKIDGIEDSGNYFIGYVYLALGELDTAFIYFNKAVEKHEGMMLWFRGNHPEILEDPRAIELLEKINVIY